MLVRQCQYRNRRCTTVVASEQVGAIAVPIPAVAGHGQCAVHLVDCAHAFKRLRFLLSSQLPEFMFQRHIRQHILAKNLMQGEGVDEGREDDVGEEAFGAMSAPDVLLAPHIATFEDIEIFSVAREEHGYLQFGEGTQKTEIVYLMRNGAANIGPEVVLKLQAFGILVVDRRAAHGALVGTVLVA